MNIAVRNAYFGEVVYNLGGTCGPRRMPHLLFVAVYKGEAAVDVDGECWIVPERHIMVVPPGGRDAYQFSQLVRTHHSWCGVEIHPVTGRLLAQFRRLPHCLALDAAMGTLLELGLSARALPGAAATRYRAHLGQALLHAYALAAENAASSPARRPPAVDHALSFIRAHYAQPCPLGAIARAAHVTPTHLVRLFRRHLRDTPVRWLWKERVRHGAELLRSTGLSVSEVAYQVGFQSPFHFSRSVKQQLGVSPKELRGRG